jgi:anti-anti-sigma regulatory factor
MSDSDRRFQDPLVVELAGDLDYLKGRTFGEPLPSDQVTRRDMMVNLTAVPLIDSLTIATMRPAHRTALSCECTVTSTGMQSAVTRMLEAAGLD